MGKIEDKFEIKEDGTIVRNPNLEKIKKQLSSNQGNSDGNGDNNIKKWFVILFLVILTVVCFFMFNQKEEQTASIDINSIEAESNSNELLNSESNYEEVSEPVISDEIYLDMSGRIGNALESICSLRFDETENTGEFSYDLDGTLVRRSIKMESYNADTKELKLKEYSSSGDYVGEFSGKYDKELGSYEGTFTNSRGISIPFEMNN